MPYCPRCGTKQDASHKACVLCDTKIPELNEEDRYSYPAFPTTQNLTRQIVIRLKNQLFFTISVVLSTSLLIILFLNYYGIMGEVTFNYVALILISFWLYMLVFFGFFKKIWSSIIAFHIITIAMLFILDLLVLDLVRDSVGWFTNLGLPITLLSFIVTIVSYEAYDLKKEKNPYVYMPITILMGSAIFSLGLELILDYNAFNSYKPFWSVVDLIISVGLSFLVYGLEKKLPDRIKNKLKWKIHI